MGVLLLSSEPGPLITQADEARRSLSILLGTQSVLLLHSTPGPPTVTAVTKLIGDGGLIGKQDASSLIG